MLPGLANGGYVASGEFGATWLHVADAHIRKETLAAMRRRWSGM